MSMRPALLALGVCAALALAGCGRKGQPHPPEGAYYPRPYPKITFPNPEPAPAPASAQGTQAQPGEQPSPAPQTQPSEPPTFDDLRQTPVSPQ